MRHADIAQCRKLCGRQKPSPSTSYKLNLTHASLIAGVGGPFRIAFMRGLFLLIPILVISERARP